MHTPLRSAAAGYISSFVEHSLPIELHSHFTMLPDEFKHSQDDHSATYTSGPNPGAVAPTPERSRPFWERPETVSLERGIPPHGPGYGAPGLPSFPPFPAFPAPFPFFGRHHHHHGPPAPPTPPPPPPGPPGVPG